MILAEQVLGTACCRAARAARLLRRGRDPRDHPRPDMALVARNALVGGRAAVPITVLGICAGIIVHALAAAIGLSALLKASADRLRRGQGRAAAPTSSTSGSRPGARRSARTGVTRTGCSGRRAADQRGDRRRGPIRRRGGVPAGVRLERAEPEARRLLHLRAARLHLGRRQLLRAGGGPRDRVRGAHACSGSSPTGPPSRASGRRCATLASALSWSASAARSSVALGLESSRQTEARELLALGAGQSRWGRPGPERCHSTWPRPSSAERSTTPSQSSSIRLIRATASGGWAATSVGELDRGLLGAGGGRDAVDQAHPQRLVGADVAGGEQQVLGGREAAEGDQPGRADRDPELGARELQPQVAARDPQVAGDGDLGAAADDRAVAGGDGRLREGDDARRRGRRTAASGGPWPRRRPAPRERRRRPRGRGGRWRRSPARAPSRPRARRRGARASPPASACSSRCGPARARGAAAPRPASSTRVAGQPIRHQARSSAIAFAVRPPQPHPA